ncbi:hypothetical protein SKAU_G00093190 [Synaphobranchus kaupii]|uniref:Peptidase A2 domain-containing protein n=1 Tax=Synaphobranchus kaupii TaxID=118154 RepID=A0A9Q1FY06_SYNKA|nr:hypothetical protein SKAU_G00093190 [Synaphobranchus kaupii]
MRMKGNSSAQTSETGLFSEAVKPHLSNPRVTDEVLIEKVNEAAGLELEQQNKLRRNTAAKPPRAEQVHAGKREGAAEPGPTVARPLSRSQVNFVSLKNTTSPSPNPPGNHTDTFSAAPQSNSSKPRNGTPTGYVPSQRQTKLISLIGERCMVQCHLDNVPVEALWDTGAQASLINNDWRKQHLPHRAVRPLSELLGAEPLVALAANGNEIPFDGWIEIEFYLDCDTHPKKTLLVPMLVSSDPNVAEEPIIGFNVIEEVVGKWGKQQPKAQNINKISRIFSVSVQTANSMLKLLQTPDPSQGVGIVLTGKRGVRLTAEQITTTYVCARVGIQFAGQSLLFVPDELSQLPEGLVTVSKGRSVYIPVSIASTSKLDVTLMPRTVLGHLEEIKAWYPITVGSSDKTPGTAGQNIFQPPIQLNELTSNPQPSHKPSQWDPPVKVDHLSEDQQQIARQLLREECHAFAYDDQDVGRIPTLNMHISLNDTTPVRKTYTSVPKPLHQEVKDYLQDLLNRGGFQSQDHPIPPQSCACVKSQVN